MKKLSGDGNVSYVENRVNYMGMYIFSTLLVHPRSVHLSVYKFFFN